MEKYNLKFDLDITNTDINKKVKKALQIGTDICFILGKQEIENESLTVRWLKTDTKQIIPLDALQDYVEYLTKVV